jgi:2-C-methyl-D-erythritol 4-phosphate cytidylyltransferase/2-C-methyl-D-erythritol 2,4-cyclodiphosphate synthase
MKTKAPEGLSDCVLIILAAGAGMRAGGETPKQFRDVAGKPVIRWALDAALSSQAVDQVVLVVPPGRRHDPDLTMLASPRLRICEGGETRSRSVANALALLKGAPPHYVMIHDAARPGLSADILRDLRAALVTSDAAAPALPVADALKHVAADGAVTTRARDGLFRVQTPQAFAYSLIVDAYAASPEPAVDDLALVEASGARIALIPGRHELTKITYPEDFAMVGRLLASPDIRIGQGFDVHAFEPGDAVMLCGVRIPHTARLKGHSDADVGWHALTDAILGAAALGDIGDHFPPDDPQWKGAASVTFLKAAVDLAAERGMRVINADITLICERPKIAPHREAMRLTTASVLSIPEDRVSVKATTTERLGFTGRQEGIAAQAVVLLGT